MGRELRSLGSVRFSRLGVELAEIHINRLVLSSGAVIARGGEGSGMHNRLRSARSLLMAMSLLLALGISTIGVQSASAKGAPLAPGVQAGMTPYGELTHFGKSHLVQDPTWYTTKQSRALQRVQAGSSLQHASVVPLSNPNAYSLGGTVVTANTEEPLGYGPDVAGYNYSDNYMWGLCGEGATTNALWYWGKPINNLGRASYTDPHTTTTWDNGNNRSYLMWLATKVMPPSFGTPGEAAYGTYPQINTYTTDLRDTLNWEASGHAANWANFYYGIVWAANLSQSTLNADIVSDIGGDHRPDVVGVNAQYLPNWTTNHVVSHYVTIIAYNNTSGTYQYLDSCGTQCGSNGFGLFTISQSQLYTAIENNNGNGSLVW